MTIDMSTTRTDLALESVQAVCSGAETGTISGVRSRERTREGYAVTDIRVEDEDGAQALGKPVGRYVTVDLGPYWAEKIPIPLDIPTLLRMSQLDLARILTENIVKNGYFQDIATGRNAAFTTGRSSWGLLYLIFA